MLQRKPPRHAHPPIVAILWAASRHAGRRGLLCCLIPRLGSFCLLRACDEGCVRSSSSVLSFACFPALAGPPDKGQLRRRFRDACCVSVSHPLLADGPARLLIALPWQHSSRRPAWVNFATGAGAALSGWVFVHPFDLLKVRAQLAGGKVSIVNMAQTIVKNEGPLGLYAGMSAAAARQLSYGNLRLGIYATLRDSAFQGKDPSGAAKLGMGCVAGGTAAFFSNPIEVALVRMQADGRLPVAERRGYTNIFNALYRESICACACDRALALGSPYR